MSSEIAIKVDGLSKCYEIYDTPRDRLKQFVLPRLQRALGLSPKQHYREFWALKDVSFQVKRGETVGIVGRNGSGKSTLLQLICGTLNPTKGTVATHGRIAALLELGSGFNPEFTGRENVFMNAAVLGLSDNEIRDRFDEIASFADIGDFIDQPVKVYSSGMVVRLAFSVAINVSPEILIVDEALSVGDELFQRKCFSKIEGIRKAGATIVFVSHSASQIVELCDKAFLIDAGEKIIEGDPKGVISLFQKLLYAPADRRQLIKSQAIHTTSLELPKSDEVANEVDERQGGSNYEFYDQNLIPLSTVSYEKRGVEVYGVEIKTVDGKLVNVLLRGHRYIYSFKAKFFESAQNVRFGMGVRTASGLFLAGSYSVANLAKSVQFIESNSVAYIEFEFQCSFNPGVYFTNAAVFGRLGDEEIVLHRIVDAAAIRVMPVSNDVATGFFWISPSPKLEISGY